MAWSGAWFTAGDWAGSQRWKHRIPATRPVVSDKTPGPSALQKRISQRGKVTKQVEYLLRGKMYSTCGWTHRQTQGETEWLSRTLMEVWIAFIGHLFWVSFSQSFWFAWFTVHIWYISGSSHTSLPQRHLGRASLNIISSWTSKEPFSAGEVGEGGVSWLKKQEMHGLSKAQPPPLIVLLFFSCQ